MNDNDAGCFLWTAFVTALIVTALTLGASINYWERQAVGHKAAHWQLNDRTGSTTFVWNEGESDAH